MQKNSLPTFSKSLVKPIKKDQNQKQNLDLIPDLKENQKTNKNERGSLLGTDLNLILTSQKEMLSVEAMRKRISFLRSFIIFISIVFGVVLIINFLLTLVLDSHKKVQDGLINIVKTYSGVEERVNSIGKKTISYKKILAGKKNIHTKTNFVMSNLGDNIEFKSLVLNDTGFSITLKVNTPFDFTNLIMRYLEGDVVSEIVIMSAGLDIQDGKFNISMKGSFK